MLDLDIKLFCQKYLQEVPTAFLTMDICRYDVQCSHFIYRNMNLYVDVYCITDFKVES